jgi:ribonuclease VapC
MSSGCRGDRRRHLGDRRHRIAADTAAARRVGDIYARWGKGQHPAALNFCDCFAYDLAPQHDRPLLFVGNDFAQTDVASVLAL